uniref:Letm1 RBD domain-containing protein n=2 Tax=Leptocylindrus danicus TaxID=163516 RepID=A0A7S2P2A4_9STRA|mmetsp:Transcript_21970/g.32951  ORF Transcript_21970/g.32951 Transcript_21970/m.32951 type:complete len:658 (+) Transcript_21970:66-2039(+)
MKGPKAHPALQLLILYTIGFVNGFGVVSQYRQSNVQHKYSFTTKPSTSRNLHISRSVASKTPLDTVAVTNDDDNGSVQYSRLRRLKDRMWARDTLEDLTAAEFACSLDAGNSEEEESSAKKRKRAVDFEQLGVKLDRRIAEMCVHLQKNDGAEAEEREDDEKDGEQCLLPEQVADDIMDEYELKDSKGMGSVVYSHDQRVTLLERIVATRKRLSIACEATDSEVTPTVSNEKDNSTDLDEMREDLLSDADRLESTPAKNETVAKIGDPIMYVRADGTIDWDGALQNREALKKFGTSVWARINGQDPEMVDDDVVDAIEKGKVNEDEGKVTAKIVETDEIRSLKTKLDDLEQSLKDMEVEYNALLNSGVRPGTAVGNVNFATLDPILRAEIRQASLDLEKKRDEVSFQRLNYELERVFVYLETEVGSTSIRGYIPLQDRLNVAEFGLLESQVSSFNQQIESGEIIDADVLAVVVDQVTDLKRRLGIDYYVTGLTFDKEAIQRWLNELWIKIKKGSAFYAKGCVLLWNDIAFCLSLFGKALKGYTLKPREVRTLRRTFKDIITFIPVVIILIIPLSPVGHVFVFGAIQRFFPDFFPTCFSERRQNLLQLYESTEYSELTIDESWKEKIARASEAFAFVVADNLRKLYNKINGQEIEDKS